MSNCLTIFHNGRFFFQENIEMKDIEPTSPLFNLSLSYSCKPNIWFSLICDVKRSATIMSEKYVHILEKLNLYCLV